MAALWQNCACPQAPKPAYRAKKSAPGAPARWNCLAERSALGLALSLGRLGRSSGSLGRLLTLGLLALRLLVADVVRLHELDQRQLSGIADAVAAAERSDVVVAVVGDHLDFIGETLSTATLELQGGQVALLDALAKTEGIICALESAHAVHYAMKRAAEMPKESIIVVNLSGRGDKDMGTIMQELKL